MFSNSPPEIAGKGVAIGCQPITDMSVTRVSTQFKLVRKDARGTRLWIEIER